MKKPLILLVSLVLMLAVSAAGCIDVGQPASN